MRIARFVITAALLAGLSSTAFAQSTATQPTPAPSTGYGLDQVESWFASAYLGSNFGGGGSDFFNNDIDIDRGSTASLNFGGELGYAWNGTFGAEFMVNHSPNFEAEDVLFQRRPSINTYMVNLLAAGQPPSEVVRQAALFGTHNRDGWGTGLTILSTLGQLLPVMPDEQAHLALFHGAHRFRYTLYDGLQIKKKRTVAVLCYGAAIVGSVAALAVLWAAH